MLRTKKRLRTPSTFVYSGDSGVSLGRDPMLVNVNLVRSSKMPALVGDYHATFCADHGKLSSTDAFVSNGRQQIPLAGDANLELGDLLGFASAPLLRVPFDALDAFPSPSPSPSPPSAPAPTVLSPSTAPAPQIHVVDASPSLRVFVAPPFRNVAFETAAC